MKILDSLDIYTPEKRKNLNKNVLTCNHQIKGEPSELPKPDALGKFIGRQARERQSLMRSVVVFQQKHLQKLQ